MLKYLVIALLISPALVQAQTMKAGLWKAKSSFELNGLPLPSSEDEECISPDLAKDVKGTITKALKKQNCELTKWSLKGQKLEASLKCEKDDLKAEGTLKGTVTEKTYDLAGEAEGSFKMIPSSATLKLTGKWVKNCKP
jgi:hypothetical protein